MSDDVVMMYLEATHMPVSPESVVQASLGKLTMLNRASGAT